MRWRQSVVSRILLAVVLLLPISVVQFGMLPFFLHHFLVPDLCFLLLLAIVSQCSVADAFLIGIAMGYVQGITSGTGPLPMFVWPLVGLGFQFASQGVYVKQFFPLAGVTALSLIICKLIGFLGLSLWDRSISDIGWRMLNLIPQALVTGLMGPPLFQLISRIPLTNRGEAQVSHTTMVLYRGDYR